MTDSNETLAHLFLRLKSEAFDFDDAKRLETAVYAAVQPLIEAVVRRENAELTRKLFMLELAGIPSAVSEPRPPTRLGDEFPTVAKVRVGSLPVGAWFIDPDSTVPRQVLTLPTSSFGDIWVSDGTDRILRGPDWHVTPCAAPSPAHPAPATAEQWETVRGSELREGDELDLDRYVGTAAGATCAVCQDGSWYYIGPETWYQRLVRPAQSEAGKSPPAFSMWTAPKADPKAPSPPQLTVTAEQVEEVCAELADKPAPIVVQVGHRYRTRDGDAVTITSIDEAEFVGAGEVVGDMLSWSEDGCYFNDKSVAKLDLVEDLGPAPVQAEPKRPEWATPFVVALLREATVTVTVGMMANRARSAAEAAAEQPNLLRVCEALGQRLGTHLDDERKALLAELEGGG